MYQRPKCSYSYFVSAGVLFDEALSLGVSLKLLVTLSMNPNFTEVILNSFIFVMDIFCTKPTRKFWIIDLTHEASFCLIANEI